MRNIIIASLLALLMTSCGEYARVQKSQDYNYKFDYAKRAYEEGKYVQAATLLEDCISVFKGTDKGEDALYLLGMANYENKDYLSAGAYLKT